jgi:mRNA interferase RelE/StbE
MASYKIVFKSSVEKDLRSIPKATISRVFARLEKLKEEPRSRQTVKLSGAEKLYRIRVGDYRVIFEIDDEAGLVIVQYVRHRRDAYRDM